jgi:hypothetical protein
VEGDTMTTFDDVTFQIIDVGDKRINKLNDRFVRYLLAGGRGKPLLIAFINAVLLLEGDDEVVNLEFIRHDFRKRGTFYCAKRHALKLEAGSGITYVEIKPTITICLLAFVLLGEEEEFYFSRLTRERVRLRKLHY